MATDRRPSNASSVGTSSNDAATQFAAMLRSSALPTLAVSLVAVGAAALAGGARPAWSAALGAAMVIVFFSLSLLVMQRTAAWQPTAVMSVVLATYTVKIIALGVAMVLLRDASWLSGQALALTVIACTIVWLAFEMRAFTRLRVLVSSSPLPSDDEGAEGPDR
jgi:ATP synthase protein I